MSDNARKAAEATVAGLMDGSLHTFAGPIKNQAGEVKVAAGQSMSDGDMSQMDWYVEGVEA
jgi:simple sugar transport system substrate-binding protein